MIDRGWAAGEPGRPHSRPTVVGGPPDRAIPSPCRRRSTQPRRTNDRWSSRSCCLDSANGVRVDRTARRDRSINSLPVAPRPHAGLCVSSLERSPRSSPKSRSSTSTGFAGSPPRRLSWGRDVGPVGESRDDRTRHGRHPFERTSVTEIPEHLLKRSRERRAAAGDSSENPGTEVATTKEAAPAAAASATPATTGPAPRTAAAAPSEPPRQSPTRRSSLPIGRGARCRSGPWRRWHSFRSGRSCTCVR